MTVERKVFIKNWIISASVGINPEEKNAPQRIRMNLAFFQKDTGEVKALDDVVDYGAYKSYIAVLVESGHHDYLENLASNIADLCLENPHMTRVEVTLEKLDIFLKDCESCGVTIVRSKAG